MRVAVTGATGFVGHALIERLVDDQDDSILAISRSPRINIDRPYDTAFGNLGGEVDWCEKLSGVDVLVHTASRVHVMNPAGIESLDDFHLVNVVGALDLANQAATVGVRRFIYISSIKVNGEFTNSNVLFTSKDINIPSDPYGLSKYEAEVGLKRIAKETDMEVIIIRPPLVYGPGVKANFASMLRLAATGLRLPFGLVTHNRRSLVFVENLVDLIVTCISHPAAANETFLVSDNEDLSTADMFSRLARSCGKSGRLLPMPKALFKVAFKLIGKPDIYQRLCGSLQTDISDTINKLDWTPPYTVDEGFNKTAHYYLNNK